jgi:two-component system response regulator FixJ
MFRPNPRQRVSAGLSEPIIPQASAPDAARVYEKAARQVYIVDDDGSLRRSLSFSLKTAGYNTRAFASGQDFLDAVETIGPGCVLLDVRMSGPDGPSVLRSLAGKLDKFAVITMTGHGDIDTAVRVMKLGSLDFLEKPFSDAVLKDSLDMAFAVLAKQLRRHFERKDAEVRIATLTSREKEVFENMVAGQSNKDIAGHLNLSARTVEMHRANLMHRLGVTSVAEAVLVAIAAGVWPRS